MLRQFSGQTALAGVILAGMGLGPTASAQVQTVSAETGASVPEDEMRLGDVVVTATGFEQLIEQAPASISMLSREELEEGRYQSLAETIADVEGVDVGSSVGKTGGLEISIRGMPSDYTLVLVDGRRQNAAGSITPNGFGSTSSSFIPPMSAIDRIEVVRGPVSTLYGSDAMGGVVNIITRKVGDRWGGAVSADATLQADDDFGNIYGTNLYANGPLVKDRVGLALRGRYQTREASDLTYTDENGDPLEVSKRGPSPVENEIWSVGGRLSITPNANHDIMIDYDVTEQWYDNSEAQLGTLGIRGYAEALEFNQEEFVLAHNWRLSFGELQSTLSRGERETVGRILPSDVPGTNRVAGDPRELVSTNTIFDTKLFSQWRTHTFTVGGQFWDAEMVDGVAPETYTHEQWALFVEDTWQIVPTFNLTFGARMDDHSQFGDHLSPRLYGVWNVADHWTLKGGVSQGFKTPRLDQIAEGITGFTGQGTRPVIGTPSLQPETSTSSEIAVFYDNRDNFRADFTIFHNQFEDKIASGTPLDNCSFNLTEDEYTSGQQAFPDCADYGYWPDVETYSQTVNVDEAVTQGAEASFRWSFLDDWSLRGNYTYTDSEQKSGSEKGLPLNDTPEHMLNARLRWHATEELSLWLRGEYRSSRYRSEDRETSTAKATYGDYKAYELFHLGGSYALNESVSFNATIYNLLDKDFMEYEPYVSNTLTGDISYTNRYAINQEPRRLWVSVNVNF